MHHNQVSFVSFVLPVKALDASHVSAQVLHGQRGILFLETSDQLVQVSVKPVNLCGACESLGAELDLILKLSPHGSEG